MRVTDAQVHIWGTNAENRPAFPLTALDKAMKEADVDRVVLVPSTKISPNDTKVGNEYLLGVAEALPHRFAVMGLVDARLPERDANLAELMERPGVKGVRVLLRNETPETIDWIAKQAVRRNFPIAVLAAKGSFDRLAPLVDNHPDVSILLDHVAMPENGPDPFANFDRVLKLVKHKNLVVKSSGMSRWSKEAYPFKDIHSYIRRLAETFGPERMAWGSDYSLERKRIPYREAVDLFREACDFLSTSDREWILDKTLSRVIGWN